VVMDWVDRCSQRNHTLRALQLENNRIGADGATALALALKVGGGPKAGCKSD
jgi:hypothetical protein